MGTASRLRRATIGLIFGGGVGLAAMGLPANGQEPPSPGEMAPAFTARTAMGQEIDLKSFRGQPVVLEWTNHQCPYVRKHYETGNMQALQQSMNDQGVVWISIVSSAPGKQGHVSAEEALSLTKERGAEPDHVVLDPEGDVGRLYGATATPHMFVIDAGGRLQYMGAIDDKPSTRHETVESATNYVKAAWSALQSGEKPEPAATQAYGCSVKY